jgi:hypothetical protein
MFCFSTDQNSALALSLLLNYDSTMKPTFGVSSRMRTGALGKHSVVGNEKVTMLRMLREAPIRCGSPRTVPTPIAGASAATPRRESARPNDLTFLTLCCGPGTPPGKSLIERLVLPAEILRAHPHLGPAAGPTAHGFRPPAEKLAQLFRGQFPTFDGQRRYEVPHPADIPSFPSIREYGE